MQSDYEYHEGTFTNSTDADGHDNTTHAHSSITGSEVVVDSEAIQVDYTYKVKREDSDGFFSITTTEDNKPAWAKKLEAEGKNVQWNPLTKVVNSWFRTSLCTLHSL